MRPAGLAPRPYTARPFNTQKVHLYFSSASPGTQFLVSVKTLIQALGDQLGLVAQCQSQLVIKLQSMTAWGVGQTDATNRPSINADISSLVPTLGDPATPGAAEISYPLLKKLYDQGSNIEPARVGYSWPRAMRDVPLSAQSNFIAFSVSPNTNACDVYFVVQWAFNDVAVPV